MAGVIVGYLSYEVVHYAIHRSRWFRHLFRPWVRNHLYHHHKDDSRCFGVTSPLWDWVFRTGRRHRVIVTHVAEPAVSSNPRDAVIGE